jgi:hypothetical protein
MDKVYLDSRYSKTENWLEKVAPNRYKLHTKYNYRTSMGSPKFVDPSGGPMMIEGEVLEELGKVIKRIDFVQGEGTFIELEE